MDKRIYEVYLEKKQRKDMEESLHLFNKSPG